MFLDVSALFSCRGGFPGSQPVSMDMKNIALLSEKPYRVSWKADGTRSTLLADWSAYCYPFLKECSCPIRSFMFFRYMMLILRKNEVFFLDRDNSVFQVENLRFPNRKDPQRHIENTLLDGVWFFCHVRKDNTEWLNQSLVLVLSSHLLQEMVIDKTETGESIPRYLVYDIIRFNGQELMNQPFYPVRYHCIRVSAKEFCKHSS